MVFRLIFSVFLIVTLFIFPWWLTLIFVLSGSFYFKNFYEAALIGLAMDSLYGSVVVYDNLIYKFTIISLISVFVINKIRQKLIMY